MRLRKYVVLTWRGQNFKCSGIRGREFKGMSLKFVIFLSRRMCACMDVDIFHCCNFEGWVFIVFCQRCFSAWNCIKASAVSTTRQTGL